MKYVAAGKLADIRLVQPEKQLELLIPGNTGKLTEIRLIQFAKAA